MTDQKNTQAFAPPPWVEQNRQHFAALKVVLQELDTQRDSLPKTFSPKVFLQFINGAVNEINRLTNHNNALTAALMDANKKDPISPEETKDNSVDVAPV